MTLRAKLRLEQRTASLAEAFSQPRYAGLELFAHHENFASKRYDVTRRRWLAAMRQVLVCVAVWVVSVASPPVARAQGDVVVTTLTRENHVLVSLELRGAYTEEVRDTVASGLETTFSFDIELRQPVAFWLDRTVDRVSVSASVRYDGLIGRYRVRRKVNGRVEQEQVVEEEAAVRQLLTTLERLPLFSTRDLEANGDYSVRVRVDRRPRTGWFRWPWDRAAALGRASFTFLP